MTVTQGPRRDSFPLAGKGSFGPHQSGDLETPGVGTPRDQETSRLIIPTISMWNGSSSTASANLVKTSPTIVESPQASPTYTIK